MENENSKFYISNLSEASWLVGVCKVDCLDIVQDKQRKNRLLFKLNVTPEEGKALLMRFGSSESFQFDAASKNLRGKLFEKLEELNLKHGRSRHSSV
jgi:hypothetical protein